MSIGKLLKSIVFFVVALLMVVLGGLTWLSLSDRANVYPVQTENLTIPTFSKQVINFIPSYDETKTLPFTAGAIIDVDNDGVEEIFIGGGIDQQDAFFRFKDGEFEDMTADTGWIRTHPIKPLVRYRWIWTLMVITIC